LGQFFQIFFLLFFLIFVFVFIELSNSVTELSSGSNSFLLPVVVGVPVGCAVLVVVALFIVFATCVSRKAMSKHSLHLEAPVPFTITSEAQKNKKFLLAPSEANAGPMEFLRESLDFHEQLGNQNDERLYFLEAVTIGVLLYIKGIKSGSR